MLSLILSVCKPIFGTGKSVGLDSAFCVSKGITKLEFKDICRRSNQEVILLEKSSSWGTYWYLLSR